MAFDGNDRIQVAQASTFSMPSWDEVRAAGTKAVDKATALGKKAIAEAPGATSAALEKAKHLDTPRNEALVKQAGSKVVECAVAGGHIGLALCATQGAYEHATGKKLPIPDVGLGGVKTTIAKKIIESATGRELPDIGHAKQHVAQEIFNRAAGTTQKPREIDSPFDLQKPPPADEAVNPAKKVQQWASNLMGKAHAPANELPPLTIHGTDKK